MDEAERRHLESLRTTRVKRLRVLEQQAEHFGPAVPPHVTLEIDDLREKIAEVDQRLGISSTAAPVTTPDPPSTSPIASATPSPPSAAPTVRAAPLEVFFSYAHEDETLRDKLAKQLQMLVRQGIIAAWHDRQISAGTEWADQISQHLNTARMILLLISSDFIASDYCYDVELKWALDRHNAGEARVIPIILRPTDWQSAPFGKLQALPKDAKPITTWANEDEAFLDVARGIRRVAEELGRNP